MTFLTKHPASFRDGRVSGACPFRSGD